MATRGTDAIRAHHRRITEELDARVRGALDRGTRDDLDALVALLEGELVGHARAEQRELYPVVDELVRRHGRATATMDIDHERITELVKRVAADVERLRAARERQPRIDAKARLRESVVRLETLLEVHLAKEERVYLPLVEQHLGADEQARLVARMGDEPSGGDAAATQIDVREIPQRERHPRVLDAFAKLGLGASLEIASDHDPRPLSYQFEKRHSGAYSWTYLARGPVWRVRVTRIATG